MKKVKVYVMCQGLTCSAGECSTAKDCRRRLASQAKVSTTFNGGAVVAEELAETLSRGFVNALERRTSPPLDVEDIFHYNHRVHPQRSWKEHRTAQYR